MRLFFFYFIFYFFFFLEHTASKHLRDEPDICYAAVQQNGFALRYCSKLNRDDENICLAAAENNPKSFQWASAGVCVIKMYYYFLYFSIHFFY